MPAGIDPAAPPGIDPAAPPGRDAGSCTSCPPPRRCGFVAIVGAPNVGKSTLVNRLVGTKVSIVSPKAQTTRLKVLGIVVRGASQIVLVDTPGLFEPRCPLDEAMVAAARRSLADSDRILVLMDSRQGLDGSVAEIARWLAEHRRPAAAVLNKIDLVAKPLLLALASHLAEAGAFESVFMISALTGDGCEDLLAHLAEALPEGPWLYPEDQISDLPNAVAAAEITREQLYWQLQEELPYVSTVLPETWQERADGSVRIEQTIIVERPGQKAIVVGKKGDRIKAIGEAARKELERAFDRRVHLLLTVAVREKWRSLADGWRWHRLEAPAAGGSRRPRQPR
jgi:GTP-binding protein Era